MRKTFSIALFALASCGESTPSMSAPDGSTMTMDDPCSAHTTCEACADVGSGSSTNNCDWCAGRCVTRPAGVSDFTDDGWCEYGHAYHAGRCTELGGARIQPTALPVDCRHSRNESNPRCHDEQENRGMVGAGLPFPNSIGASYMANGYLDAASRTIYLAAANSVSGDRVGSYFAVDLDTGDRTLLSGPYDDPRMGVGTAGTGPETGQAFDIEPHPAGGFVAWGANGWFRIDASGNRTLVHPSDGYCRHAMYDWNFPNEVTPHGMTLDEAGRAIVPLGRPRPTSGAMPPEPPDPDQPQGMAVIDESGCSILMMASADETRRVGTGRVPQFAFAYPLLSEGVLWSNTGFGRIFRIDPATGDRLVVSAVQDGVGSGGMHDAQPGEHGFFERAGTLYAVRGETSVGAAYGPLLLTEIDVASGDVTPRFNATEIGLNQAFWAAPHPDDEDWIVIGTERFLAIAELSSGNVNLLSF
jgi:hypothetical protein